MRIPSRYAGLCAVLLAFCACREKGEGQPPRTGDDAGMTAVSDGGERVVVTEAQLRAYAQYQRAMVEVYDTLFRELERLPAKVDGGAAGIPAQVRVVEAQALAEERARTEAGLTEGELSVLEPLVLDVLNARALVRSLDAQGQLQELEAMRDQLEGDARAGIEQTIEELRAEQAEAEKLSELRMKYGEVNVDRVLSHERELQQNHELWLSRIAGGRK